MLEVYIENRSLERISAKQMAAVLVRVLVAPFQAAIYSQSGV